MRPNTPLPHDFPAITATTKEYLDYPSPIHDTDVVDHTSSSSSSSSASASSPSHSSSHTDDVTNDDTYTDLDDDAKASMDSSVDYNISEDSQALLSSTLPNTSQSQGTLKKTISLIFLSFYPIY
jgi:hypothetical protein